MLSKHERKRLRLDGYDYSLNGGYFVTICIKDRQPLFGNISGNEMQLSCIGSVAKKFWLEIPKHYEYVILDQFVIMPNHVHGIIFLRNENIRSLQNETKPVNGGAQSGSLSSIIRGFKIGVTKYARQNNLDDFVWQKSFHDRIIRNESELNRIRQYIIDNPKNWQQDDLFL